MRNDALLCRTDEKTDAHDRKPNDLCAQVAESLPYPSADDRGYCKDGAGRRGDEQILAVIKPELLLEKEEDNQIFKRKKFLCLN